MMMKSVLFLKLFNKPLVSKLFEVSNFKDLSELCFLNEREFRARIHEGQLRLTAARSEINQAHGIGNAIIRSVHHFKRIESKPRLVIGDLLKELLRCYPFKDIIYNHFLGLLVNFKNDGGATFALPESKGSES
uniref:Uncharacterized protein n=1 Tax=Lepeophtheirus salmonis TaxID=72036 RepID=A0A0K2T5D0_LEPSM